MINGGRRREDIDTQSIAGQFKLMMLCQLIISLGIVVVSCRFISESARRNVLIFTAIYLLAINFNNFYGMIFQAVNQAKIYSTSLILDKIFFLLLIVVYMVCRIKHFEVYIGTYCIGRVAACIYSFEQWPELLHGRVKFPDTLKQTLKNISIGINLMLSVILSSLVLGVGRFVVDKKWGIEAFGIFSFSLTLSNFVLQFINQISVVLFPALRQIDKSEMRSTYIRLRKTVNNVLGLMPLAYVPLRIIVMNWLPQYEGSLKYVVFFLPMCYFDGKMQLISTTFMKVFRQERKLLKINVITLIYSAVVCFIGGYLLNNLMVVMLGMITAVIIRSCIADYNIGTEIHINIVPCLLYELFMVGGYWGVTFGWNYKCGISIYMILYVVQLISNRNCKGLES